MKWIYFISRRFNKCLRLLLPLVSNSISIKTRVFLVVVFWCHWRCAAKPWRQQPRQPCTPISQLVRSVSTCLRTRNHCRVSTPSVSNVLKDFAGTSYRETERLVPSVERNFEFHKKGLAGFSIILLCSSWQTRKGNDSSCEKVVAIRTKMSRRRCIVMTAWRTSVSFVLLKSTEITIVL